ncbi:non-ribosomal peptide synthetase [Planosporangium thailandense]|uniref:Non-ribosomal peptide synthetase n=1 Tax=Planosporangium thailandense TaxID=765197 RepID=A0ABX0Y6Q2_9ACTN|nr:non-ribosomal peptide synthetase [Planosporangium thailandense]NJC73092.1 non-ribosomal peptide synthetase [Planosporangium thailandense]
MTHDLAALCLGLIGRPVHPHQVAIRAADQTLTHADVADRVRAGASFLASRGVGVGSLVGVPAARSARTVIDVLAVLAARCAFVVVDEPQWLGSRLRERLCGVLGHDTHGRWVLTPIDAPAAAAPPPLPGRQGDGAAYVMSTSGSTGEPKETVVTRGGLRHVFGALHDLLGSTVPPAARWTQLHPLTFGFAMCEILGAITFGGELTIVERESPLTLDGLLVALGAGGPRVVCLTPSELALLVRRLERDVAVPLPSHVLLSGEPMHRAPVDRLFRLPGGHAVTVVNTYAATETSGQITVARVPAEEVRAADGFVGRPLPGVEVVVREPDGRAVPSTDRVAVGEICVSGPTVAGGYLDPVEDARRFRRRLVDGREHVEYRTGDLGRWGADGGLHVLGRADRRVKVGGRWLELDAVERHLRADAQVAEAAVLLDEGSDADGVRLRCLLAAVVPAAADPGLAVRLRRRITALVGAPMTVRLLVVPALPTLPNGKADPRRLARVGVAPSGEPATSPGGAGDEVAEQVDRAWAAVLGAGAARHVNIFELGVDSIGVVAVAAQLSRLLGREVTPEFLFDNPRLALQIEALRSGPRPARVPSPRAAAGDAAARRRQARLRHRQEGGLR